MSEIYPCRIIICSDEKLAQYYNEDPRNALTASRCISVEEGYCLLEEKTEIETIVLVNEVGEDLVCYLGEKFKWNKKNMPDIVRINVPDDHKVAVKTINESIAKSSFLFLGIGVAMGCGGGAAGDGGG